MSTPKYFYGVKGLVFYNRTTLAPVGIFRVISSVEYTSEIEKLGLAGGHHNGKWAYEAGEPEYSIAATLMEFPDFAYTELDNAERTITLGEDTSGFVDTIANRSGTSIVSATTGIASVAAIASSESKLPLGRIVVEGTAVADEVNVYLLGDTATGPIPVTGELPLLAAAVTIPGTSGTISLADYGIEFTGGSGSIALVDGDTAVFETRPANTKTTKIVMPDQSCIKELGCVLVYPKNSQGIQTIVDFPKVAIAGTPFSANTREYAEFEMTGNPMFDEDEGALWTKTEIVTNTGC